MIVSVWQIDQVISSTRFKSTYEKPIDLSTKIKDELTLVLPLNKFHCYYIHSSMSK